MKKESMFLIGMSSLAISLIMGMILPDLPLISFFEGMFVGISLATNIGFLIRYRLEKDKINEINSSENHVQGE